MPTKGTTVEQGYDAAHKAERKRWEPAVATGQVTCARCGGLIPAGSPWDLGHNEDRTAWTGPEHPPCNRSAGAVNSHIRRSMIVREW